VPAESGGLKASLEALGTFKKRVDDVLAKFEGSPGSAKNVETHRLSQDVFSGGGGFGEATGLHRQYERVHERLTALSKHLGLQLEAMQIAVGGARTDFSNLEEEERRRFWEIQILIQRHHQEAERDRAAAEAAGNGRPAPEYSEDKETGAGYQ
jgi:hypothetical protein